MTVAVTDGSGATDAVTIPVVVLCRNAPPVLLGPAADAAGVTLFEGNTTLLGGMLQGGTPLVQQGPAAPPLPAARTVSFVASDVDGPASTFAIASAPSYALTVLSTKGVVSLAADPGDAASVSLLYGDGAVTPPSWSSPLPALDRGACTDAAPCSYTVTGSVESLSRLLRRVAFTGMPGASGPARVTLTLVDLTSAAGSASSTLSVPITLLPVNEAPSVAAFTLAQVGAPPVAVLPHQAFPVGGGGSPLLRLVASDADALEAALPGPNGVPSAPALHFSLSVTGPSAGCVGVSFASLAGLALDVPSATGRGEPGALAFFAPLSAANAAFSALELLCAPAPLGTATPSTAVANELHVVVDDGGFTGAGGPLQGKMVVELLVTCACTSESVPVSQ